MSSTSFTLKWVPSESDGGSPIIEYIVEIREAKTKKDFKKIGATKGDITNIPVNYLEKDHGYQFRITARNVIGLSEPYSPEDTIVAGSRISKYTPLSLLGLGSAAFLQTQLLNRFYALGIHYQFSKTDETLYCLLGIFPPAKLKSRSKYLKLLSRFWI